MEKGRKFEKNYFGQMCSKVVFAVVYSFTVKTGAEEDFKKAWKELTELIYKNAGSLGSRLHREDELHFIAYAQWPHRQSWKESSAKLPERAELLKNRMQAACTEIKVLYELDVAEDLLNSTPHNS